MHFRQPLMLTHVAIPRIALSYLARLAYNATLCRMDQRIPQKIFDGMVHKWAKAVREVAQHASIDHCRKCTRIILTQLHKEFSVALA